MRLFLKPIQPRVFTYHPQYYNSSENQNFEKERRGHFDKIRYGAAHPKRSVIRMLVLFILLSLFFVWMQTKDSNKQLEIERIQVEEITE